MRILVLEKPVWQEKTRLTSSMGLRRLQRLDTIQAELPFLHLDQEEEEKETLLLGLHLLYIVGPEIIKTCTQTERLSITFTSNGKGEFVPRDQVFHYLSFIIHYFYSYISSFTKFFIHKNCFELFLSAHSLFWDILINWIWRLPIRIPYTWGLSIALHVAESKRRQCMSERWSFKIFLDFWSAQIP